MKNTTALKFYLLIFLLTGCLASDAQPFDSLLNKLDTEYPQEKLYLHFDKPAYNAGETIWFKAYLFSGNSLSLISKNLYTELLDAQGKVLERKISPLIFSSAASSFDIPENINSPVVYIRAYTKWMLNFDSSFLYTKAIPVVNIKRTVNKPVQRSPKNTTEVITPQPMSFLQFFPEGGDLIEQVESKVAFKATDRTGMPLFVSGNILDSKKNNVAAFSSIHDGMGSFTLLPKTGEIYKAIWKDEKGKAFETVLPAAKPTGVVLEIANNSNQIKFKIKRSATGAVPYDYVHVVAQMNQALIYRAKAILTRSDIATGSIPTENLPAGIVQVTVFTPDNKPIAERIVFVNRLAASFITDLNTALKDPGKRKKNVIQIDVPDTIVCNLSVAVTDADLPAVQEQDNIFSKVLLTSDIKGYVHKPAYYFSGDEDSVTGHLDLVMMTNGWRRFKWNNILAGNFPKLNYMPEKYLSIEGQVYGVNKTLLANKEIISILQLKNGNKHFLNTPLQPDGKFIIPDVIFYDTAKVYYQINNDKKQSLTTRASFDVKNNFLRSPLAISPDSNLLISIIKSDTALLAKNEIYQEQLSKGDLDKVKTLKEVVVKSYKKSKEQLLDEEYTSGFFSGGDASTFSPENDPSFSASQNVLQYLQGRVAGLQISLNGGDAVITRRGSVTALFLNEMTTDASLIQNISMSDVALVKVFSPPFFGAMGGGAGGAIAVYTKKGVDAFQSTKGLDFVSIEGYSPVKEFYSPDYSKTDSLYAPDHRSTLYWNPYVVTDRNHRRILLPFYNNDVTKKMKVIIEGCNEEGKLTRVEKILQ